MVDLTEYFSKFAGKPSPHGTLKEILTIKLNQQQSNKRKNYFGVTEICNPLQTYFKVKYPEKFVESIETKKKYSLGNKQHNITKKKFERLKGFEDSEIILDGELLGIPLKGRADSKINGAIWELKSKKKLPENTSNLIQSYPQDIEQLSFYSLLDPSNPKEDYLIFTTHFNSEYKAFKIRILNLGKIKDLVLARINKLKEWLDIENPKILQRCRYCNEDCILKNEGLCSYFKNEPLPCEVKDYITIEESPEIERLLKEIKLFDTEKEGITYSIYRLIIARKIIQQEGQEVPEEDFDNELKKENAPLIQELIYKLGYNISKKELNKLNETQKIREIYQNKNSFIKLISNGEQKIFPMLVHVSTSEDPTFLNNVHYYKKGELGIHCLNNGSNKGYLIVFFPKQKNEIRVFEINYNFEKESLRRLKNIVEILNTKDKGRLSELPKCPDFLCKKCPYKKDCPEEDYRKDKIGEDKST